MTRHGILWVSYAKDFPWFEYSARSFAVFGNGWGAATCVVPAQDYQLFVGTCRRHGIALEVGDEWAGKGFLWHMFQKCRADLWLPHSEVIHHLDSDTVFTQQVTPQIWMAENRPVIGFKRFSEFPLEFGPKMWQLRVEKALGFSPPLAVMTSPPYVFRREVYRAMRRAVEAHTGQSFSSFIQGGQNDFPQDFCEFETIGAIAQRDFYNDYEWRDVATTGHPSDGKIAEGWSWGGLDKVTDRFDSVATAREIFTRLGL